MKWQVLIESRGLRELDKLDKAVRLRIWKFLYERLAQLDDPRSIGQALKGSELGDLWKYRVGDYRIIYQVLDDELLVLIVKIGDRKTIYRRLSDIP